jgi:hypothetical protein
MSTHHVLWTGGWDSTFRVADLVLHHRRTVQPHYGLNPYRDSRHAELRTMDRLREEMIALDPSAERRLRPVQVYAAHKLAPDPSVQDPWARIHSAYEVGSQYGWLVRMARQNGLDDLELSIHVDDRAQELVAGNVVHDDAPPPDDLGRIVADPTDPDLRIFDCFTFPLFKVSKPQMAALAGERGFATVMESTWFCHQPTWRRQPCGRCGPCRYTRDEGLARRVPPPPGAARRAVTRANRVRRQVVPRLLGVTKPHR